MVYNLIKSIAIAYFDLHHVLCIEKWTKLPILCYFEVFFICSKKMCKQIHCVVSYLKRSKLCIGMIQIFKIPEGDDFRLLQAINFLQIEKCARIPYNEKIPEK